MGCWNERARGKAGRILCALKPVFLVILSTSVCEYQNVCVFFEAQRECPKKEQQSSTQPAAEEASFKQKNSDRSISAHHQAQYVSA